MLYITYTDIFSEYMIGIRRKIMAQIRVFQKNFGDVFYTRYARGNICLYQEDECLDHVSAWYPGEYFTEILKWIQAYNIRQVYIRYNPPFTMWFVDFVRELKARGITMVLEIPTYPYDGEFQDQAMLEEDQYYRKQLKKYVPQVTTYSAYKEIYGMPVIMLQNGIDPAEHTVRKKHQKLQRINLLAVAGMARWHGYERLLEGIWSYSHDTAKNKQYAIHLYFVGVGPELYHYKQLTKEYGLQKHVTFCGKLYGKTLDDIYEKADIGIGSIGFYKIHLYHNAPIKLREYCVRGLPFLYGYEDEGFTGEEIYNLRVENDASPIDMVDVIRLYERTVGREDIINEMREYAEKHFAWDKLLEEVIHYYG